jgi:hypothetical protein
MKVESLPRSVLAGRERLAARVQEVLRQNDMGGWTRMASELYPHQWSWDSGFIAIGLAHLDTPCRAGAASGVDGGLRRPPLQPRRAKLAPRTPLASDC